MTIYTVGHSTRTLDELLAVLHSADVQVLVDVRTVPRSRRHPQFERAALEVSLPEHGVGYRHEKALGGFRRPSPDSPNTGWREPAFCGYADHMRTPEFLAAVERLIDGARRQRTCVMCAEAQWWRCHRRLLADALLARGCSVLHLGLSSTPAAHELTAFAVVGGDRTITYPPAQATLY